MCRAGVKCPCCCDYGHPMDSGVKDQKRAEEAAAAATWSICHRSASSPPLDGWEMKEL